MSTRPEIIRELKNDLDEYVSDTYKNSDFVDKQTILDFISLLNDQFEVLK